MLKLETLMENAVDKNFDKLEIWTLRNVLCLPRGEAELARWVRLGHYEGVQEGGRGIDGGEGEGRWDPERLYELRRRLVETRKLHAALAGEAGRNARLIAQLKGLLRPADGGDGSSTKRESASPVAKQHGEGETTAALAFLTHTPAAKALGVGASSSSSSKATSSSDPTAHHPLATHASFTTSQLPHLRSLLATLRPHLASTALPPNTTRHSGSDSPADASRERRLYLESQSKRILERRGVDTREGVEGAVEGGRVRAEEVRGLEGIVEALGRGVEARDANGNGKGGGEGEAMDTS